jgi:hypothetical protein
MRYLIPRPRRLRAASTVRALSRTITFGRSQKLLINSQECDNLSPGEYSGLRCRPQASWEVPVATDRTEASTRLLRAFFLFPGVILFASAARL